MALPDPRNALEQRRLRGVLRGVVAGGLALAQTPVLAQGTAPPKPPTPPTQAKEPPGAPATPGPVQPVEPVAPIGPVAPLPAELDARQAAPRPAAPVVAFPGPPAPDGIGTGPGRDAVVAGAAESGFVVVDPERLFGFDAIPEFGAAIVAAAGLRLAARLEVEYDDNEARVAGDLPPGSRFDSRDDVILRPLFRVDLGREAGQQLLFVSGRVGRTFHLLNDNLGFANAGLDGGVNWRAGAACSGRIQAGWQTREASVLEFDFGPPPVRRLTRLLASASCNRGYGLVPSVAYDRAWARFRGGTDRLADSNSWGLTGSLGYAFGARGQVGVQLAYREAEFINQPIPPSIDPDQPNNGIDLLSVGGFAAYQLGTSLAARGSLGWSRTRSRNPEFGNFAGITGNISLAYSASRLGLSVSFGRNSNLGNAGGAGLRIVTEARAAATYRLSDRLSVDAGVGHLWRDNRGSPRFGNPFNLVNDRYWLANAGLNFQLSDRIALSLDYGHRDRSVEEAAFANLLNYRANRVIGAIRIGFP
ncbi:hypothetical protein [Thermaurantiacus sp.]